MRAPAPAAAPACALAAALLLAACNPAAKEPAAPAGPAPDSDEGRATLQLESRLGGKVALEHTRKGELNGYKLFCGDAVGPDGKRQRFALSNGILILEAEGGVKLMDDMQAACDAGHPVTSRK